MKTENRTLKTPLHAENAWPDPWIQTVSGRKIRLAEPDPENIVIGDIAHALARINRFNGHTLGKVPYSVAQHSIHVSQVCQYRDAATGLRLAGLLHDAHEAYLGDLTRPLKLLLASQYLECVMRKFDSHIEDKWLQQSPFGLRHDHVKYADLVLLATEQRDLMAPPPEPWMTLPPPWHGMKIVPWGVEEAERRFLERFEELIAAMK